MATKKVNGVEVTLTPQEAAQHAAESDYNAEPQRDEERKDRAANNLADIKRAIIAMAAVTYAASAELQAAYDTKALYLKAIRDEYRAQL